MKRTHPHVIIVVGGVKAFVLTEIGNVDYYCAGSGEYALEAILEHEHSTEASIDKGNYLEAGSIDKCLS